VPKKRRKIIFGILWQETGTILRRLCEYKGIVPLEGKAFKMKLIYEIGYEIVIIRKNRYMKE